MNSDYPLKNLTNKKFNIIKKRVNINPNLLRYPPKIRPNIM
jgi:hypothetical protein